MTEKSLAKTTAVDQWLNDLALTLSDPNLPAPLLVQAFDQVKSMSDLSSELYDGLRLKLIEQLGLLGNTNSAGTMTANIGEWHVEARLLTTAPNAKKLEALLRAKGMQPEVAMDATVAFKVNPDKLEKLVVTGILTEDEVDTCRPPKNYALQRPTKLG